MASFIRTDFVRQDPDKIQHSLLFAQIESAHQLFSMYSASLLDTSVEVIVKAD